MPVVEPFKAADMPAYESSFHQAKCACRHVSPVSWSEVTNWCLLHCWKKEKLLLVVGWSLHQLVSSSMGLFMFLVGLWLTLLTAGTAHSRGNGTQICVPQNCRLLFLLYYFHTLTDCFLFFWVISCRAKKRTLKITEGGFLILFACQMRYITIVKVLKEIHMAGNANSWHKQLKSTNTCHPFSIHQLALERRDVAYFTLTVTLIPKCISFLLHNTIIMCPSVHLSVCLSQASVVPKYLNAGLCTQFPGTLVFWRQR